jgi:hypothetical protein
MSDMERGSIVHDHKEKAGDSYMLRQRPVAETRGEREDEWKQPGHGG